MTISVETKIAMLLIYFFFGKRRRGGGGGGDVCGEEQPKLRFPPLSGLIKHRT